MKMRAITFLLSMAQPPRPTGPLCCRIWIAFYDASFLVEMTEARVLRRLWGCSARALFSVDGSVDSLTECVGMSKSGRDIRLPGGPERIRQGRTTRDRITSRYDKSVLTRP
jgi:hypothetical protein